MGSCPASLLELSAARQQGPPASWANSPTGCPAPPPGAHMQRGAYAYRSFRFTSDGVLSAAAADHVAMQLPAPPAADYDPAVAIDRVVVLGLADGPAGWTAELEGEAARQLDAAPGPLYLREGLPEVALVVRRAGLPVSGNWRLRLRRVAGAGGSVS